MPTGRACIIFPVLPDYRRIGKVAGSEDGVHPEMSVQEDGSLIGAIVGLKAGRERLIRASRAWFMLVGTVLSPTTHLATFQSISSGN